MVRVHPVSKRGPKSQCPFYDSKDYKEQYSSEIMTEFIYFHSSKYSSQSCFLMMLPPSWSVQRWLNSWDPEKRSGYHFNSSDTRDGIFWLVWSIPYPGSTFIKPDQLDLWIKDQLGNALLSTILSLQLPNFVSCGRACPSHMTQNLVTV